MKTYNSMYMGICINNNDPEKRGRVQIFIPHIMPSLYKGWNEDGKDIDFTCVGKNLEDNLSIKIVKRLIKILPWAECASPIMGTSAPGNLITKVAERPQQNGTQDKSSDPGSKSITGGYYDQSPQTQPPDSTKSNEVSSPGTPTGSTSEELAQSVEDTDSEKIEKYKESTSISGEIAAAAPHQKKTPLALNVEDFKYGSIANPNAKSNVKNEVSETNTEQEITEEEDEKKKGGVVLNTDRHNTVVTQNINNMAKGVFSYPAAGAILWVFFKEGNPEFPVYFATSYSKNEWSSAYGLFANSTGLSADGPGYRPTATNENPTISTGGLANFNGAGGFRWEYTTNPENHLEDQKSFMLFGEDGSNVFMGKGYNQYFTKFDRRDQVEGDRWETTLGFKEDWVQGDSSNVTMGDVYVKIGNISTPVVDAITRMEEIIKEIQEPLTKTD